MPRSVAAHAAAIGARLRRIGTDFDYVERADGWDYVGFGSRRRELPLPALAGVSQLGNAAVALAMLESVEPALLVPDEAVRTGLGSVRLAGRFQVIPGSPEWILDVAHNAEAAASLAASLAARPMRGARIAVCGILADKDVEAIVAALAPQVDRWIAVGLDGPRALAPAELARRIGQAGARSVVAVADVAAGLAQARVECGPGDRVHRIRLVPDGRAGARRARRGFLAAREATIGRHGSACARASGRGAGAGRHRGAARAGHPDGARQRACGAAGTAHATRGSAARRRGARAGGAGPRAGTRG